MKSLFLALTLLLVPTYVYGTGCNQQVQQVQQVQYAAQPLQALVYAMPILAQHQNQIVQYSQQLQQNVQYAQPVQQQNVKQKIRTKQVVQKQRQKRNLRERVQNMNVDYQVPANALQKVQGNY